MTFLRNRWFLLGVAVALGAAVTLLPRPDGTRYEIAGDAEGALAALVEADFRRLPAEKGAKGYTLEARSPGETQCTASRLQRVAEEARVETLAEIGQYTATVTWWHKGMLKAMARSGESPSAALVNAVQAAMKEVVE